MLIALLIGLLLAIIVGVILMASYSLTGIYSINAALINIDFVKELYFYTRLIAIAILVVVIMVKGIRQWQLYHSGDPSANPIKLITNAAVCIFMIFGCLELVRLLLQLSNSILHDLSQPDMMFGSIMLYSGNITKIIMDAYSGNMMDASSAMLIDTLYKLIFSVGIFIVIYQVAYRTIEIVALTIVGPIFSLGLMTESSDWFMGWLKTLAGIAFGHIFQYVLMLFLFFSIGQLDGLILRDNNEATATICSIIMRVAGLGFVIKAPKFMQELMFNSGSGGQGGGGVLSKAFYIRSIVASGKSAK